MKTKRTPILVVVAALALGACGGSDPTPDLSEAAISGREIAQSAGCLACHGGNGQGGVGPTWQGLAGSSVELEDGTTVVADSAYLERAIVEPQSEVAKGYTIAMPKVNLTVDEVAAIITYIEELK